jgi:hypothetical protein
VPGWATAGRLAPVEEGTARRREEGQGFAWWVRRRERKSGVVAEVGERTKRGTCTTAEFGDEVDASQSGGKTAALHAGFHGNAQRPSKIQIHKQLQCMAKETAADGPPGEKWLLRYCPEVTLHLRPVVFWGWPRVV